jgi:hypothetical protein
LDSSIIQGPFSVAPCQTLSITIRNFFVAVPRVSAAPSECAQSNTRGNTSRGSAVNRRDCSATCLVCVFLNAAAAVSASTSTPLRRVAPSHSETLESRGRGLALLVAPQLLPVQELYSGGKVANRNVGFSGRGRSRCLFATPAEFPLQHCSPYSHVHVRRDSLGFVHCSRQFCVAPCQYSQLLHRCKLAVRRRVHACRRPVQHALEAQRHLRGGTQHRVDPHYHGVALIERVSNILRRSSGSLGRRAQHEAERAALSPHPDRVR